MGSSGHRFMHIRAVLSPYAPFRQGGSEICSETHPLRMQQMTLIKYLIKIITTEDSMRPFLLPLSLRTKCPLSKPEHKTRGLK